jgi:hypothetical protein
MSRSKERNERLAVIHHLVPLVTCREISMKLANPKLFKAVNYALLYFQVTNLLTFKVNLFQYY